MLCAYAAIYTIGDRDDILSFLVAREYAQVFIDNEISGGMCVIHLFFSYKSVTAWG